MIDILSGCLGWLGIKGKDGGEEWLSAIYVLFQPLKLLVDIVNISLSKTLATGKVLVPRVRSHLISVC
jgi:hypothetical protein